MQQRQLAECLGKLDELVVAHVEAQKLSEKPDRCRQRAEHVEASIEPLERAQLTHAVGQRPDRVRVDKQRREHRQLFAQACGQPHERHPEQIEPALTWRLTDAARHLRTRLRSVAKLDELAHQCLHAVRGSSRP